MIIIISVIKVHGASGAEASLSRDWRLLAWMLLISIKIYATYGEPLLELYLYMQADN